MTDVQLAFVGLHSLFNWKQGPVKPLETESKNKALLDALCEQGSSHCVDVFTLWLLNFLADVLT